MVFLRKTISLLILISIAAWSGEHLDTVRVQLKAKHQFEFAGFYAAIERGFYREEGFAVKLIPNPTGKLSPVDEVIFGRADYGVQGMDIIRSWSEGKPVLSLAVIFQRSPTLLIAQSDYTIPHQLAGKPIYFNSQSELELRAMFLSAGVHENRIQRTESDSPIEDFIAGKIDAISGLIGDEPEQLLRRKVPFNVIRPDHYAADFYGDCLFTSKLEKEQNPERVLAFTKATLRGWNYALEKPEEVIQIIHQKYAPNLDVDHLRFEAKALNEIHGKSRVILGEQDAGIWQQDADILFKAGLIKRKVDVHNLVYDLERMENEISRRKLKYLSVVALVTGVLLILFSVLTWFLWNGMNRRNRELSISQNRLEQALKATSDAVFDWPDSKGPIWLSKLGYELMGLDPGRSFTSYHEFTDRIHQEDRPGLQSDLDYCLKTLGSMSRDLRILVDGSPKWIRLRAVASSKDGVIRLSGILQDIHQLKTAEINLRETESRFRQYFELGLVGMAAVDTEGRFIQVNRVLWEMLETTEADLLYKDWRSFTHKGDQALEEDLMESVMKGERQGYTIDKRFLSLSGITIYALVATRAVLDAEGKVIHWVMLILDISQRRQGEQEKERILHQLSLKNRTLEGMLHTISHDFRHPLVNVMWYTQEISKSLAEAHTSIEAHCKENPEFRSLLLNDVPQFLKEIQNGSQVLDRMLGGMLALSRLGRQNAESVPVDMNQVIRVLIEEKHALIDNIHADVSIQNLPKCLGSESMLYQVFSHLLDNAIQYRDPDRNLKIQIDGKLVREWVVYSMDDNGIGIPASNLGHIFSPFFRINPRGNHNGDGLGLTFVTRILESHRGHIKVESVVGKGSRFSVFLPRVPDEQMEGSGS